MVDYFGKQATHHIVQPTRPRRPRTPPPVVASRDSLTTAAAPSPPKLLPSVHSRWDSLGSVTPPLRAVPPHDPPLDVTLADHEPTNDSATPDVAPHLAEFTAAKDL